MNKKTLFVKNNAAIHRRLPSRGFTLIELMIVVAVIAILAAIAIPSYESYVRKSRVRVAMADIAALSLNIENEYRRQLKYPTTDTADTAATMSLLPGWSPAMKDNFKFTAKFDSAQGHYQLKAIGTGKLDGCTLQMEVPTTLKGGEIKRTLSGNCGVTEW